MHFAWIPSRNPPHVLCPRQLLTGYVPAVWIDSVLIHGWDLLVFTLSMKMRAASITVWPLSATARGLIQPSSRGTQLLISGLRWQAKNEEEGLAMLRRSQGSEHIRLTERSCSELTLPSEITLIPWLIKPPLDPSEVKRPSLHVSLGFFSLCLWVFCLFICVFILKAHIPFS